MCVVAIVKNEEKSPLKDCQTVSKVFDYNGGVLLLEDHAIKVTIPIGAIEKGYVVQIEAAASLFGPFIVPKECDPVSAYVWIGTCYEFKKKVMVEIEHDVVVCEETTTSDFCVLTACEEDVCREDGRILHKMHEDACEYEVNKSKCTFFTSHFCSKCLASKKSKTAKWVIMYHYLPSNYKLAHEFVAEVSFCYDLTFCRQVCIIQRYKMVKNLNLMKNKGVITAIIVRKREAVF